MPRFGRIEDNVVREIIVADKLPTFHPDIAAQFREVPEAVEQRWVLNGDVFEQPTEPEPDPPTLAEQLDAIFMALPPEVRAQFYPLKAAVKLALDQKDTLGALAIIQITTVPSELQEAKDAMLALFGEG